MNLLKGIPIDLIDKELLDLYERFIEKDAQDFISDLNSLELKYNAKNIEKYTKYLNYKLSFPVIGYHTIDNGIFGVERLEVKILSLISDQSAQEIKCICEASGNSNTKIPLHLIEVVETGTNKEMIDHFQNWYLKYHKKK